jgi:hypothetical protein
MTHNHEEDKARKAASLRQRARSSGGTPAYGLAGRARPWLLICLAGKHLICEGGHGENGPFCGDCEGNYNFRES